MKLKSVYFVLWYELAVARALTNCCDSLVTGSPGLFRFYGLCAPSFFANHKHYEKFRLLVKLEFDNSSICLLVKAFYT